VALCLTDRKHPTAAFWITVALVVVLVVYPLSFGPACWLTAKGVVPVEAIETAYRPVVFAMLSPELPGRWLIGRYTTWCGGGITYRTLVFRSAQRAAPR